MVDTPIKPTRKPKASVTRSRKFDKAYAEDRDATDLKTKDEGAV